MSGTKIIRGLEAAMPIASPDQDALSVKVRLRPGAQGLRYYMSADDIRRLAKMLDDLPPDVEIKGIAVEFVEDKG